MDNKRHIYENLQLYIPKELFAEVAREVWHAVLGKEPLRESLAIVWSRMALQILRTHGKPLTQKDALFEQVLDEVVFLSTGGEELWKAIEEGNPLAYTIALDKLGYYIGRGEDYRDLFALANEWLVDQSDIPTIPAPPPKFTPYPGTLRALEPFKTRPGTPSSLRARVEKFGRKS